MSNKVIKPSGLEIVTNVEGDGNIPESGQTVVVHYRGTLEDGTKFDSSFDRNQPFEFQVGRGRVIKGWDEAFIDMKVGTHATITVPPDLGYGKKAMGPIPSNSTLIFDIELLEVK